MKQKQKKSSERKNGINKKGRRKRKKKKDLPNDRLFFKVFFDLLYLNTSPNRTSGRALLLWIFAERPYCLDFRASSSLPPLKLRVCVSPIACFLLVSAGN